MKFSRIRAPFLLAAAALMFVVGACGGDDPEPDPVAELRFFHAAGTLGEIDIEVGTRMISLGRDELSSTIRTDPGSVTITVSNTGAQESLFTRTTVLDEGQHVFVIAGRQDDSTLSAFEVGLNPPELEEGQAAFQVVNVRTSDAEIDVYFEDGGEASTLGREGATEFATVLPADAEILVFNEGANVAVDTPILYVTAEQLDLRASGVYTVLVSGDRLAPKFTVTRLD